MNLYQIIGAAVVGLIIGSFLNMLIPRLHKGEKGIFWGRSHCVSCGMKLSGLELIPGVSYFWLKGKCHHCKNHISWWYPATEFISAFTFVALALKAESITEWLLSAGLFFVLLFIFLYDLRYKEIHDAVMLPGIVFAFIVACLTGDITDSLIGGLIGFCFFAIQYYATKGRAIGAGDMRIGAFIGLMLGWHLTLIALVISYVFGSIISIILLLTKRANAKTALPLGPFLVIGSTITYFFGLEILQWYLLI